MGFSAADAADLRRYCGYGALGQQVTPASGYRFFTAYGVLEYRLANCTPEEAAIAQTQLATLRGLEAGIPTAGLAMDTDAAAGWTRNRSEAQDRIRLYQWQRVELCRFLGVPPGPGLPSPDQSGQLSV